MDKKEGDFSSFISSISKNKTYLSSPMNSSLVSTLLSSPKHNLSECNSPVLTPVARRISTISQNSTSYHMTSTPKSNPNHYESFLPYDKMLESLEEEEALATETETAIYRVIDKEKHERFTQMSKVVHDEQEYQTLIEQIQQYSSIKHPGLVSIRKWSYQLSLDKKLKRVHRFLVVFDSIGDRLDSRYTNDGEKSLINQFKRDDYKNILNLIQGFQYIIELQKTCKLSVSPIIPCNFFFSQENTLKFAPQPFLMSNVPQKRVENLKQLFFSAEVIKNPAIQIADKQAIFSLGMNLLLLLTNNVKNTVKTVPSEMAKLLQTIQTVHSPELKHILEKMIAIQSDQRCNFYQTLQFCKQQSIFSDMEALEAESFQTTDDFSFFAHSGYVKIPMPKQKYAATIFPLTKRIVQTNLFDQKRLFIEQLDLNIDMLLPEDCAILSGDNFQIWVVGGKQSNMIFLLNDEVPSLIPLSNIPCSFQRFGFGACAIDSNFIFLAGGIVDGESLPTSRFECYDINSNEWVVKKDCIIATIGCTLVSFNNKSLYKFGGKNIEGKIVEKLERYDISTNTWQLLQFRLQKELEEAMFYQALGIQINPSQILICGGYKFHKVSNQRLPNMQFYFLNIDEEAVNLDKQEKEIYSMFSLSKKISFPKSKTKDIQDKDVKRDIEAELNKQLLNRDVKIDSLVIALNNVWFIQAKNKQSKVLYSYNEVTNIVEQKRINY